MMNLTTSQRLNACTGRFFLELRAPSNGLSILIIFIALLAFEVFNISSTNFALRDILRY